MLKVATLAQLSPDINSKIQNKAIYGQEDDLSARIEMQNAPGRTKNITNLLAGFILNSIDHLGNLSVESWYPCV